jgi:hypothetical protein
VGNQSTLAQCLDVLRKNNPGKFLVNKRLIGPDVATDSVVWEVELHVCDFKPGDIVMCVRGTADSKDKSYFTEGKTYEVISSTILDSGAEWLNLKNDQGQDDGYSARFFVLPTPSREQFNQEILSALAEYLSENPEMRFYQALSALNIITSGNEFYTESEVTWSRVKNSPYVKSRELF